MGAAPKSFVVAFPACPDFFPEDMFSYQSSATDKTPQNLVVCNILKPHVLIRATIGGILELRNPVSIVHCLDCYSPCVYIITVYIYKCSIHICAIPKTCGICPWKEMVIPAMMGWVAIAHHFLCPLFGTIGTTMILNRKLFLGCDFSQSHNHTYSTRFHMDPS